MQNVYLLVEICERDDRPNPTIFNIARTSEEISPETFCPLRLFVTTKAVLPKTEKRRFKSISSSWVLLEIFFLGFYGSSVRRLPIFFDLSAIRYQPSVIHRHPCFTRCRDTKFWRVTVALVGSISSDIRFGSEPTTSY